jgi:uncharacterized protein YfkK (UPF0435 family)
MLTSEETLTVMWREIQPLLEMAMEGVLAKARSVLEDAEQQRAQMLAGITHERAKQAAAT